MKTKYIKKLLMCRPLHFSVDYIINPWMKPGSVNKELAMQQWQRLVATLQDLHIAVDYIDQQQRVPDMVFSTDQGITVKNTVLLSSFRYPERRKETPYYREWFLNNNYLIKTFPDTYYLEGSGESLFWRDILFIGVGFRSSRESVEKVADMLNVTTIPLELVDPRFYHLDLALLPLNNDTVFYYPPAFSEMSQELLKKTVPNLLPFTTEESENFAANSLVTDHHVVIQENNTSFKNRLRDLGYYVVESDVSEFLKAGGGIHCLVQVLQEEYE